VRQDGTGDDDREAVLKTVKTYAQLPRENMSERYAHTLIQRTFLASAIAQVCHQLALNCADIWW
jgi:hypothetical protein